MADAVAQDFKLGVAAVFPKRDALARGPLSQRKFAFAQQRPHEGQAGIHWRRAAPLHSGKAVGTGTAQQAQQNKFGLIIGMMRERNHAYIAGASSPHQEFVAQLPRGHFQGQPMAPSVATDVRAVSDTRQAELSGGGFNEPFIGIRTAAPKLVVEMGDLQLPAKKWRALPEEVEQDH